jgi:hypothetical protein
VAKIWRIDESLIGFDCPGCGYGHCVPIVGPNKWTWNGDVDSPSIHPSILVNKAGAGDVPRCHSIILNGRIMFCADSTHELTGKTVPLPEIE